MTVSHKFSLILMLFKMFSTCLIILLILLNIVCFSSSLGTKHLIIILHSFYINQLMYKSFPPTDIIIPQDNCISFDSISIMTTSVADDIVFSSQATESTSTSISSKYVHSYLLLT